MCLILVTIAGLFMDRIGSRRAPFLLCLVCLVVATALLAVGTNIGLWFAGRLLQGASAGILWVVCLALITDTVSPGGIGQAVGTIGIPMSIGPILGPLLGGVIYAQGGYYAVFGLMFAMLGMDAVLRLVMIEKKAAQRWIETEVVQPDSSDALPKTQSPLNLTPSPEPPNTVNGVTGFNNKTPNIKSHYIQKSYHHVPAILKLLLSFRLLVALTGGFLQSSLNVAFDSTLPLTVNALFGWEQTGQGLIFITMLLPSLLQPLFGAISDRHQQGRRLVAATGCLLAAPAYILLRLVTCDTLGQKVLLCFLLVIIGLAMAIAMPAIIAEIGAAVADAERNDPRAINKSVIATGWSLVNAAYAAGCLVGPLFAGLIRNTAGWETTTWCLGLLSAVTGVFLILCLGGWIGNLGKKSRHAPSS